MNNTEVIDLLLDIHNVMGDLSSPIVQHAIDVWPEMDTNNLMWARRGVGMAAEMIRRMEAQS